MSRYDTSLYRLSIDDPSSFTSEEMENLLYGLTQSIPEHWKNPRFIAKGGQAILVKAYSVLFEKDLAIKFCLPVDTKKENLKKSAFDFLGKRKKEKLLEMKEEFEKRFIRGAKHQKWMYDIAKQNGLFKYAYIPEVYSSPNNKSMLHYSMEFVESIPIIEWSREQTSKRILLEVYENVLNFIRYCFHDFGTVHRDLKPDNVLIIKKTNLPVIVDFGLCKVITDKGDDLTHPTSVLGNDKWSTRLQMTSSKLAGFKDDIYTLGLLFWSIVTKEIPSFPPGFKGKIKVWEIFPPNEIPSDLEEFVDFFMKATNEDSDLRYPNLDVAIEGFQQCMLSWERRKNTKIIEKTSIEKIEFSNLDWEIAKQGLSNQENCDAYEKIVKGIELMFFEGKNK